MTLELELLFFQDLASSLAKGQIKHARKLVEDRIVVLKDKIKNTPPPAAEEPPPKRPERMFLDTSSLSSQGNVSGESTKPLPLAPEAPPVAPNPFGDLYDYERKFRAGSDETKQSWMKLREAVLSGGGLSMEGSIRDKPEEPEAAQALYEPPHRKRRRRKE